MWPRFYIVSYVLRIFVNPTLDSVNQDCANKSDSNYQSFDNNDSASLQSDDFASFQDGNGYDANHQSDFDNVGTDFGNDRNDFDNDFGDTHNDFGNNENDFGNGRDEFGNNGNDFENGNDFTNGNQASKNY